MTKEDWVFFEQAVDKLGAVDARVPYGEHTIVRCFNSRGEEVCLWVPGVSQKVNVLNSPRAWTSRNKRALEIVARKADVKQRIRRAPLLGKKPSHE